ncbi:MAG: SPOR domain-containing protein [Porticoccaceae bacterium]
MPQCHRPGRRLPAALLLAGVCALPLPFAHAAAVTFATGKAAYEQGDFRQAESVWKKLAEQGDVQSQFYLGVLYDQGSSATPKDDRAATAWFDKAARQGHVNAQFNLGNAYMNGRGVAPSPERAVYWWRQAADNGSPNAQFNLAIQYYQGKGVAKDWDSAVYYFNKAASNGHAKARELIDGKQVPKLDADRLAGRPPTSPPGNLPPALAPAASTAAPNDGPAASTPPAVTAPSTAAPDPAPAPAREAAQRAATPAGAPSNPEDWLRGQDPGHYTIQLVASGSTEGVARFVAKHQLADDTVRIQVSRNGQPFYYLLMGSFPDRREANLRIESLPAALRTSKPWARPFREMQSLLNR